MYRYETHLHTSPVSACATAGVRESLLAYRELGYDGVFITNHFLGGNICRDVRTLPYREQLEYYYSAYLEAKAMEREIGIKVFFGIEMGYKNTDFLVYGLGIDWYMAHPEIMEMKKSDEMKLMRSEGALIVHAHPFREAQFIDHIRLYPRDVDAVEVLNCSRTDMENRMAELYAEHYGLIRFGGTDNHAAGGRTSFGGVELEHPILDEGDFVARVMRGEAKPFMMLRE